MSNRVMPASMAASTTAAVASASMRIPKLLQPNPTVETISPESPNGRYVISGWSSGALIPPSWPFPFLPVATTDQAAGTRQLVSCAMVKLSCPGSSGSAAFLAAAVMAGPRPDGAGPSGGRSSKGSRQVFREPIWDVPWWRIG